jgi:predicted nucleic acid-binding protein
MRVVVDASVAVKWCIAEVDSDAARAPLETDHELIAPELLGVEVANALWTNWRRKVIDIDQMDGFLARLPQLIRTFVPDIGLVADAATLSRLVGHPVFDCIYLALARQAGGCVVTMDDRFLAAAGLSGWHAFFRPLSSLLHTQ